MRVLVLGGTRFIGRHIVSQLLSSGAKVTLLHRGWSRSPFGAEVTQLVDDRRAVTEATARTLAKPWDVVVDTSGHDIDHVSGPARHLGEVGLYVYLSTCSVYARPHSPATEITERSAVLRRAGVVHQHVSALRRLQCERHLDRELDARSIQLLTLRLSITVGPFDQVDRFAYWLERAIRGGDALVPMHPDQDIQLVDVRDVAEFVGALVTAGSRRTGVLNVAGPRTTASRVIDAIAVEADPQFKPRWVGEQFALAHHLVPWTEVPLWLPPSHPDRSLMAISSSKAQAAGLRYRPLADTVRDSLAWRREHPGWSSVWLDQERETALLGKWRS